MTSKILDGSPSGRHRTPEPSFLSKPRNRIAWMLTGHHGGRGKRSAVVA